MSHLLSVIYHRVSQGFSRRWLVACLGILLQLVVIALASSSFGQAKSPAIQLAPVPEEPNVCRIIQIAPFTNVWRFGVRAGDIV